MKEVYIEIGQTLKNYRLKRKLTLEKITDKTKISIQNLNNIENGNLHLIGGEFYQRSFIKSFIFEIILGIKMAFYPVVNSKIALARSPLASSNALFALSSSTPAC